MSDSTRPGWVAANTRAGAQPGQVARQHGPLAACLVQDRADVVDLLVHGRRGTAENGIRQADAPVVVHDEPAERRQPAQEPRQRRLHPRVVHVRVGPGLDHQQVRRPAAQHLVRQMDRAIARIAGLRRNAHVPIVTGGTCRIRRGTGPRAHCHGNQYRPGSKCADPAATSWLLSADDLRWPLALMAWRPSRGRSSSSLRPADGPSGRIWIMRCSARRWCSLGRRCGAAPWRSGISFPAGRSALPSRCRCRLASWPAGARAWPHRGRCRSRPSRQRRLPGTAHRARGQVLSAR